MKGILPNFRDGKLHITLPVQAYTDDDVLAQCRTAKALKPDMIEWRADAYSGVYETEKIIGLLPLMREIMKDTPILFTCRERPDNGQQDITFDEKVRAVRAAVLSGYIDVADIEVAHEDYVPALLKLAHSNGVQLIVSHHDWQKTPSAEEMERIARKEYDLGADIVKYSFFANTYGDIARIAEMTLRIKEDWLDKPVFSIAGGEKGMISRICGRQLGTDLTFASTGATFQINIEDLRHLQMYIG